MFRYMEAGRRCPVCHRPFEDVAVCLFVNGGALGITTWFFHDNGFVGCSMAGLPAATIFDTFNDEVGHDGSADDAGNNDDEGGDETADPFQFQ